MPDETVVRYEVEIGVRERQPDLDDDKLRELLRAEFQRALNAGHFSKVFLDAFSVKVCARA